MPEPQFYRSVTRQQMERAGRALSKRIYTCGPCGMKLAHDECHTHWQLCEQRHGSTVKVRSGGS